MSAMGEVARVRVIAWQVGIDLLSAVYALELVALKYFPAPLPDVLESGQINAAVVCALMSPLANVGVARMEASGLCRRVIDFMGCKMQGTPPTPC